MLQVAIFEGFLMWSITFFVRRRSSVICNKYIQLNWKRLRWEHLKIVSSAFTRRQNLVYYFWMKGNFVLLLNWYQKTLTNSHPNTCNPILKHIFGKYSQTSKPLTSFSFRKSSFHRKFFFAIFEVLINILLSVRVSLPFTSCFSR